MLNSNSKKLMVFLGVLVLLVIVAISGVQATSTTGFCSSCHSMNEAYQTWDHSTHQTVNCLKCHADEGLTGKMKAKIAGLKQVAITVSGKVPEKIKAEVKDENCLDCHEKPELKEESKLNFNHQLHLANGAKCTTCHARVVHTLPGQKKLDKKVCLDCHQKTKGPVNECAICHKSAPKPQDHDGNWLMNHKKVIGEKGLADCMNCHEQDFCSKCHH